MDLTLVWFIAIAVLWTGYLVLEGFDFGVGMLIPALGRNDRERRLVINTIGPLWDGNEVWLLVAGGAMFAAFPAWYAGLFSGFYLPLLIILLALILRGVAFDYRGKREEARWKRGWDACLVLGSAVPSFFWGVVFSTLLAGMPLDERGVLVGGLGAVITPYSLLGGLALTAVFWLHGAIFVSLKTDGELRYRARRLAQRSGPVVVIVAAGWLAWSVAQRPTVSMVTGVTVCALLVIMALVALRTGREGWAFAATAVAIIALSVAIFTQLYPTLMLSTLDPAWSLTAAQASSTPYTLRLMTICAAVALPLVLGYQTWSYWVFRKRLTIGQIPAGGH